MFSRLCKNTIFPTGLSQSSATSSAASPTSNGTDGTVAGTSPGTPETAPDASLPANNAGGSVAVVAAAIAADRRRRRQQLGGRNLPSLPVLPPRSRGPIRAPEPPPPYWAHYAHRPVPAAPSVDRIGGAASVSGGGGGGAGEVSTVAVAPAPAAVAAAAGFAGRRSSASTTDDSDTSNDRPSAQRGRSRTSGESSSTGWAGGAAGHSNSAGVATQHQGGQERAPADARHRYNLRLQQRQRIKEHLLSQDAFCPDLVRNCKNIATESPERQSSPAPGGEYAEIGELSRSLAAAAINVGASTSAGRATAVALANRTHADNVRTQPAPVPAPGHSVSIVPVSMGQNLSIRRPKISLTWVLREQSRDDAHPAANGSTHSNHQQQPSQHPAILPGTAKTAPVKAPPVDKTSQSTPLSPPPPGKVLATGNGIPPTAAAGASGQSIPNSANGTTPNGAHNHHHHHVIVRKKSRTRSKERLFSEKYVSDNNLTEYHSDKLRSATHANEYTAAPSVAAPTGTSAGSNLYRKSNRKNSDRLKKKERLLLYPNGTTVDASVHQNNNNQHAVNLNKEPSYGGALKEKLTVPLKNTYSEPSLYTTVSEPSASTKHRHHRHHHRRRRERYRSQRFGYEIHNVDEFLSKCSLSSPGNIPVVLSSAATLYQTRPGSYQIEIPLPLGMVVNAVFKNQSWLYVQTPHAEEGYVAYDTCLPLGILPSNQRSSSSSKPTPCWESNKDIFPKPCGNLTDSEKEIQQLRGGTRSEGRRTPRLKRSGGNSRSSASITACHSERDLDSLYLRTVASNQPKVADGQTQYAQLKLTTKVLGTVAPSVKSERALAIEQLEKLVCSGSGDYVHLLKQQQQQLLLKQQQYLAQLRQQQACKIEAAAIGKQVTGVNGLGTKVISGSNHLRISLGGNATGNMAASSGPVTVCSSAAAVRQTLLAITENYCSEALSVYKGDVVTLLACKEYQEKGLKNYKQWFFVRTRDGHEGYIPAEAAGHGFL